jgi:hypothetical protein
MHLQNSVDFCTSFLRSKWKEVNEWNTKFCTNELEERNTSSSFPPVSVWDCKFMENEAFIHCGGGVNVHDYICICSLSVLCCVFSINSFMNF